MKYLFDLSYLIMLFGFILLIYSFIRNKNKNKAKLKKNTSTNYAIIIPARDESAVIEGLLKSLQVQTDLNDTYIIVEKQSDKTVKIAQKYGANIFVRTVTKDTKRKGYALDECFKYILNEHKKYDLFFIFDADNIVKPNFIDSMLKVYQKGYQIASGYRNIKNNDNVVANCSGLTFTMLNSIINVIKMKNNREIITMGTGFYIDANLIKKWNGYPFHSLTEDYELSLYCSANHISTYYNADAEFLDEQPIDMETSIKQRTRWIKGFFEARKIRLKDIKNDLQRALGVTPIIISLIGFILYLLLNIIELIIYLSTNSYLCKRYFIYLILCLVAIYTILFIFTYIIIMKDIERLHMSGTDTIKALFFNPIFLMSYILCVFKAINNKNLEWEKIEHKKSIN